MVLNVGKLVQSKHSDMQLCTCLYITINLEENYYLANHIDDTSCTYLFELPKHQTYKFLSLDYIAILKVTNAQRCLALQLISETT